MTGLKKKIVLVIVVTLVFTFAASMVDVWYSDVRDTLHVDSDICPVKRSLFAAPPNNTIAPTFENPYDTDNFYAKSRDYLISVNVTDPDGFTEIDHVSLSLYDNNRVTQYWNITYNEDANSFVEYDPNGYITLVTSSCDYWKSSTVVLDILFVISVDWNHPDVTDTDTQVYSVDDAAEFDVDWYETNWDVETRLDYLVAPSVTGDDSGVINRGDLGESFQMGGTVIYYGSGNDYPPSSEVDVWISSPEVATSPWSDSTVVSGAFSVTCSADDVVGEDTYTVKVVEEGSGPGGSDLYYTGTSATDTYIADSLTVSISDPTDQRININSNASGIVVTAIYDFDSNPYDGSLTLNDTTFQFAVVGKHGYEVTSASGDSFGVTVISVNDATYCIWDRLTIDIQVDNSTPSNEEQVSFAMVVTFDYDSSPCTTYTLVVNRNTSTWNTYTYANRSSFVDTGVSITYTYTISLIAAESLHGITAFISDTEVVVWSQAVLPTSPSTTTTTTPTTPTIPPPEGVVWLIIIAGGIAAATGVIFYGAKRLRTTPIAIDGYVKIIKNSLDSVQPSLLDGLGFTEQTIAWSLILCIADCLDGKQKELAERYREKNISKKNIDTEVKKDIRSLAKYIQEEMWVKAQAILREIKDDMKRDKRLKHFKQLGDNICDEMWSKLKKEQEENSSTNSTEA